MQYHPATKRETGLDGSHEIVGGGIFNGSNDGYPCVHTLTGSPG